jgi:AraC-like DNA-binding protein
MGFWLVEGTCPIEHEHWTEPVELIYPRIAFLRSGVYLRRFNGVESYADNTTVMVTDPGDEWAVAHPLGCGDQYTIIQSEVAWDLTPGAFRIDDQLDLHHRSLITAARRGIDELELGERIAALLERMPATSSPDSRWSPQTMRAHNKLARGATEVLVESGYETGLDGIASQLYCSPHHLSRVFRSVMGVTLTEYRNRMRVRQVLADLQDGAANLRELAARYGFADQAHMIRVVRKHCGAAPGALQRLLEAPIAHGNTTPD